MIKPIHHTQTTSLKIAQTNPKNPKNSKFSNSNKVTDIKTN